MTMTWPLIRVGSSGEDVRSVQYLLTQHGHPLTADGLFGPLTKSAVEAFQEARGLAVDGVVGDRTWPRLIVQVTTGSTGDAVRAVQHQIHGRGAGRVIAVDGIFGPMTSEAVGAFQKLLGLSVDHIVGPVTWNHLANGYLTAPDADTAARRVFQAWEQHSEPAALLDATPKAAAQLFEQPYSDADGWVYEQSQGAMGHTYCCWRCASGAELRILVENAVVGPFYAVDMVEYA